ncbi:hypothetical protein NDU88_005275 [Pleurodeles waltl]|uniref:Uncharacterized protein n=1 Tax=Pleurodeles waltl TaxID=8319 RepID=A0AAV7NLZ7_PLEWA|nr:hypothetical protein NDU88_005275 [Pleurodeles waltl]
MGRASRRTRVVQQRDETQRVEIGDGKQDGEPKEKITEDRRHTTRRESLPREGREGELYARKASMFQEECGSASNWCLKRVAILKGLGRGVPACCMCHTYHDVGPFCYRIVDGQLKPAAIDVRSSPVHAIMCHDWGLELNIFSISSGGVSPREA